MPRIAVIAALAAAIAALALGAGAAAAADSPSLVDDAAARLGVSPDKLRDAFKAALTARIDAAVAAGRLTPEQGAKLKARIAAAKGLGIGLRRGLGQRHKAMVGAIAAKARGRGPVATYLGMTRAELRAELRSGKSLAQIAAAEGKTTAGLQAAMLAPVKAALSRAVERGRLTQARADEILAQITERVATAIQKVPKQR
jgi:hypothetical protein